MKFNDLLVYEPGNQYPAEPGSLKPFTTLPAWWRRFIFSVINGREFQVYMYIAMASDIHSIAYPEIETIQQHMQLRSDSQIYTALRNLERLGFIRRRKNRLPNRKSKALHNIYQRTAPEYLLITLLKRSLPELGGRDGQSAIDEYLIAGLCPIPFKSDDVEIVIESDVAMAYKGLLGKNGYLKFENEPNSTRRELLIGLLEKAFAERKKAATPRYTGLALAPRDFRNLKVKQRSQPEEKTSDAK